jgi:hypothetical protein
MGHGPHSCILIVICVVLYIVSVQMRTVLLPSGDNPIAVNKYIISRNSLTMSMVNVKLRVCTDCMSVYTTVVCKNSISFFMSCKGL